LPNGHFAERTFYRTDSFSKIEIFSELYRFAYTVKISVIKVIDNFVDRNFDSEIYFHFIFFQVFENLTKFCDIKNY
jgi:hypothetical protein